MTSPPLKVHVSRPNPDENGPFEDPIHQSIPEELQPRSDEVKALPEPVIVAEHWKSFALYKALRTM